MKNFIMTALLLSIPLAHAQDGSDGQSTLGSKCKQPQFSCGECETGLQDDLNKLMGKITNGGFTAGDHWGSGKEKSKDPGNIAMAPGVTLDGTLQEIITMFKKHNPSGDNKLNFVVIGESESLQGSSVKNGKMYPRVMLKSPNSELMVTFNTDPAAPGYKTLEMMRWNGKQGRYEFQELNFGDKGAKPHVDATGAKCLECHKSPDPRPNWDTYRAWAGVVPSRDDMMEKHAGSGRNGFDDGKGMQPDAKAYLNFLDQVADDKTTGKKSRIAMLDIPFDEKRQMADYVKAAKGKPLTAREQVDLIKKKIDQDGYYRIKHFPDKDEVQDNSRVSFNFDGKTADWAGPSQFAFDQMLSQNMCKVATDLKKHKDFNKFKYPLALIMACGQRSLEDTYPEEYKKKMLAYFKNSNYRNLGDIDPAKKPKGDISFEELQDLMNQDTNNSHENANGYKFNRHEKFLKSYLTDVEKLSPAEASTQAKYYSEKVVTPVLDKFHAIDDVGGVKGVPEDSGAAISQVRMLLEPYDVKVSHWSLVFGKNAAKNSFSFSDQFSLLKGQPVWQEIVAEAGGDCRALEAKAKASLSEEGSKVEEVSPISDNVSELSMICGTIGKGVQPVLDETKMQELSNILMATIKPEMKKSMAKCLVCHDTGGDIEFPGLTDFVVPPAGVPESQSAKPFIDFMNSQSDYYKRPMIEVLQIKLGVLKKPEDGIDYGDEMPPTKWKDSAEYAAKHGVNPKDVHDIRRKQLGTYLTVTAAGGNKEKLKAFCEKVNNDNYVKDFSAAPKKTSSSAVESK